MLRAHPGCPSPMAGSQEASALLGEKKAPKKPQGTGEPVDRAKAQMEVLYSV